MPTNTHNPAKISVLFCATLSQDIKEGGNKTIPAFKQLTNRFI